MLSRKHNGEPRLAPPSNTNKASPSPTPSPSPLVKKKKSTPAHFQVGWYQLRPIEEPEFPALSSSNEDIIFPSHSKALMPWRPSGESGPLPSRAVSPCRTAPPHSLLEGCQRKPDETEDVNKIQSSMP